jgi:predicted Rossmann fold nucleotide-binding protein DprA/Smf involved in DNA uptake
MNYDLYWVWLSCGLGQGASCLDLVSHFEWNPYEIYGTTFNELFQLNVLTKKRIEKLKSFPIEKAEEILRVSIENGWKVITPTSEYYPERLLELNDFPVVLYVKGDETILNETLSI